MKLPAFFGHKRSINLLPRDAFESSTLGIVLEWSLVFGKWAVILTQLVVMGAFLYRFTLDRSLTDLRKSITKSTAIIKSYEQVERDYVLAQKQVSQAKTALATQDLILKSISELEKVTPSDVWYDRISLTTNTLSLTGLSGSITGFGQFLTGVQVNPLFKAINLSKLSSSSSKGAQLEFETALTLAGGIVPKGGTK